MQTTMLAMGNQLSSGDSDKFVLKNKIKQFNKQRQAFSTHEKQVLGDLDFSR